jgi:malate dehydrogenase (oxaloacetate-decarboxylating)(NADP+)
MSDPARFIPILYDPTVGEACLTFWHIYRTSFSPAVSVTIWMTLYRSEFDA